MPYVLARSYNSSNANGGVAYANANNAASNSNTNIGSRLTVRRKRNTECGSYDRRVCH